MGESDFSWSCIIGYGSSPSRCRPLHRWSGQPRDLPVPEQRAYAHARVCDHAGPSRYSQYRTCAYCLPLTQKRRRPGIQIFRGSMAGLLAPLSTLRAAPHGAPRMTRGQHGLLNLYCRRLSLLTPCRSPGALGQFPMPMDTFLLFS